MGSLLDMLSSAMQLIWPLLSIATFVVCLQVQGRHKGTKGVSLLVTGSALVMCVSLISSAIQMMLRNGGLDFLSISGIFSLTGLMSITGQVLFLVGLYQFGMGRREELYDDLLDDLPN